VNNKLHFLYSIHAEVEKIMVTDDKKSYFLRRIDEAIANYNQLKHVFKKR
jgi:hypothetical protein